MIKNFLLLMSLTILFKTTTAQTGRISYNAIINRSQPGTPVADMHNDDLYARSWLYFDGKQSLYRQLLPDSSISIRSGGVDVGYMRSKYPSPPVDSMGTIYKIDHAITSIEARMALYNLKSFHFVDDKLQPINWAIKADTKTIGKIKVVKAEATYLGRKWIAGFAPSILVSMGPWKLYGLPGLILETQDSTQKFKFTLSKLRSHFRMQREILMVTTFRKRKVGVSATSTIFTINIKNLKPVPFSRQY